MAGAIAALASCTSDQPTEPRTGAPSQPPIAATVIGCPGCFYLDHFADPDGTPLDTHVPDGEGIPFTWLRTVGPTAYRDTLVIRSNAVGKDQTGFTRYVTGSDVIDTTVVADTAEIELEVLQRVPPGSQYDVGLIFRAPGPDGVHGFGGYTAFWSINGDGLGFFEVDRGDDNGSLLLLQDYPDIPTVGIHSLAASVSKTGVINIYLDGNLKATVTDPSPLPAGDLGLSLGSTVHAGALRITSFVGRRRPPEGRVGIEPVEGSMDVWPEKTAGTEPLQLKIGVYDEHGAPVPNSTVDLTLTPTPRSAGHDHDGTKPAGTLSLANPIPTGESGEVTVQYRAPTPSGPVTIRGSSAGALDSVRTINVRVPHLVEIPRDGEHFHFRPSNRHASGDYYMAPGAMDVMIQIWNAWVAKNRPISPSKKFTITAATLVTGGLYDINGDWTTSPGHVWHRQGGDMDFDDPLAEANWLEMQKLCAKFEYQGQPVDCQRHGFPTHTHFHAVLGPNR